MSVPIPPAILLKGGGNSANVERAQEAVRRMRKMQPGLLAFGRALTRNPNLKLVIRPGVPCTDGDTIYLRPPIELGDKTPHVPHLCGKRDERDIHLCPAHRIIDDVETTLYHEIAHIAYESFEALADADKADIIKRRLAEIGTDSTTRAGKIAKQLEEAKPRNYIAAAQLVSPYLPHIMNALEDARVNLAMYRARPGTYRMFRGQVTKVFEEGIEDDDGVLRFWSDAPRNQQVVTGLYAKAAGFDYRGWFSDEVAAALDDPELSRALERVGTSRTAKAVYRLGFTVLEQLRRLGYCKRLADQEDDEQEDVGSKDGVKGERKDNEDAQPGEKAETPDTGEQEQEGVGNDDDSENPDGQDGEGQESPDDDDSDAEQDGGGEAQDDDADGSGDAGDQESCSSEADGDDDASTGQDGQDDGEQDGQDDGEQDGQDDGEQDGQDDGEQDGQDDGEQDGQDDGEQDGQDDGEQDGQDDGEQDGQDDDASTGQDDDASTGQDGQDDGERVCASCDESFNIEDGGEDYNSQYNGSICPSCSDEENELDADETDTSGEGAGPGGDADDDAEDEPDASGNTGGNGMSGEDANGPSSQGILEDDDDDGSPESVGRALARLGGHAEKLPSVEDLADNAKIDRAIVQGDHFDAPSRTVLGVNIHREGHDIFTSAGSNLSKSIAWSKLELDHDHDSFSCYACKYEDEYGYEMSVDEQVVTASLGRLRVVFSDNKKARKERNLRGGRINARALGRRVPVNDDRLFQKKREPGAKDYFVLIGLDNSGSTAGPDRLGVIKKAALHKAELLSRIGVKFAVYAHNGSPDGYNPSRWKGMTDVINLDIVVIKEPGEPWGPVQQQRLKNLGPGAFNLDGHALEFYRKVCDRQRATDRVILYYTDGAMPYQNYAEELEVLQREIKLCRLKGYSVVGIGVQTDSPKKHGLDTVKITNVKDVPIVVKELERRINQKAGAA